MDYTHAPLFALPKKQRPGETETYRALLIDLNNFASFPTMAIGLLVAALRKDGHEVEVLSPLAHDVPGTARERPEKLQDHVRRRVSLSSWAPALSTQRLARRAWRWRNRRPHPTVLREARRALESKPDALLLSAYMQHYPSVVEICALAKSCEIPVILGGPMFNIASLAEGWRRIPGITVIYGGEADLSVSQLLRAVCGRKPLLAFPGITLPDGRSSRQQAPLRPLDSAPTPDFTDFPWARYRNPVIPVMTGRGCQWNRCTFCSDIISANGRSFRTRSVESVLEEIREQSRRYRSTDFLFLDLKLNSNPNMLRGISEHVQSYVPGAEWVGTVHVDLRKDNGLSRSELRRAAAAGMRRVSFGLETGSQRLLDAMNKGGSVEANAEFIQDAHDAGISIRCTMFSGFPGETAQDLERTAHFLERHEHCLDRIRFNRFALIQGTPIFDLMLAAPRDELPSGLATFDEKEGRALGYDAAFGSRAYRRAKARVLRAVHRINRKRLPPIAQHFDGIM